MLISVNLPDPINSQQDNPEDPRPSKNAQLRSAQTLVTIGIMAGPISLLVGGVLLSTISVICSALAFLKVRRVMGPEDTVGTIAYALRRQTVIAIAISCLALALNAVSLAMVMPTLVSVMQTGDISQLLEYYGIQSAPEASSSASSSSIWG